MSVKLYVVPGSNPSMAARLMLEHKGIAYRRVDLIPTVHMALLRILGFPRSTVPAMKIDGRRVQGSLEIPRALEELRPEPRLYPADPSLRKRVEEAEDWGERVFQPVPRRLSWWAIRRDRSPLRSFAEGSRLGVPVGLAVRTASPIVWWEVRTHGAYDDQVRRDLAALPDSLARIDAWIDEGILGQDQPNAADFQIATSVRLLMCLEDLRPIVEARSAGALADRVTRDFPGRVPRVIPRDWLPA